MRNALKVAKWEIKRNLKNKTFLIGLFLTPLLFLGFGLIGGLIGGSDDETTQVLVHDELNAYNGLEKAADHANLDWDMSTTDISESDVDGELDDQKHTAYLFLDDRALNDGVIPVYTGEDVSSSFMEQIQVLANPIKTRQMQELGLSDNQLAAVSKNMQFQETTADELASADSEGSNNPFASEDLLRHLVPGAFAAIILLSIIISGMYIFQSASSEKKDKIAEIILSSVTPGELMQGKIIGYFVLGMVQAGVFLLFVLPMVIWKLDLPIVEYLLTPELLLMVAIAILGYFLFAAMFVGMGATLADTSSASNFQGVVMILPLLPFFLAGAIVTDPNGLIAQIGTYVPVTTPGVLLMRLVALENWPWTEIIIALIILVVSIWLFTKLAGKIFKTGILMYGKNASLSEIWKWIRA